METYTLLRAFADSWFLLVMVLFYLAACVYPFVNKHRAAEIDIATIPLRNDRLSQTSHTAVPKLETCGGDCSSCACATLKDRGGAS